MSTMTPTDRAEIARKREATLEAKRLAEENHPVFPTKGRTFAKVIGGGKVFRGRVGAIRKHNEGEIGLSFTSGEFADVIWFEPSELERCKEPVGWK